VQQLEHARLAGGEGGGLIARLVVERDHAVDVRRHILEEAGQEAHLVAERNERKQPRAPP
jgi:hypothetical protein